MDRCALILSISLLLLAQVIGAAQQPGTGPGGPGTKPGTTPGTKPANPPGGPGMKPGPGGIPGGGGPSPGIPGGGGPGIQGGGGPSAGIPGGGGPNNPMANPAAQGAKPSTPGAPAPYKPPTKVYYHDLDFWVTTLQDKDPAKRELAIRVLPEFGEEALKNAKVIPKIVERLRDPDPAVKLAAMLAVCTFNVDDANTRTRALTLMFAQSESIITSTNDMLRLAGANAAAHIGPPAAMAIPTLIGQQHLTHPSSYEARKAAAAALGQIAREDPNKAMVATNVGAPRPGPDVHAIRALVYRLADPCLAVRIQVVQSLLLLGPPAEEKDAEAERGAVKDRIKVETDKSLKLWLRIALIRLADKPPTDKDFDPIADALRSDDAFERITAAETLGVLGQIAKSKAGALRIGLDPKIVNSETQEDLEFAFQCIWAVGRMGTDAAFLQKELQEIATKHKDQLIKDTAKQSLDKVQGKLRP